MKKWNSRGFSVSELLVGLSVVSILSLIAFPNLQGARNQLRVTDDTRSVAMILTELRTESIRLKRNTTVAFTDTGLMWDFYNDGSIDGSYNFAPGVRWEAVPDPIIINGFGLIRGINSETQISISHGEIQSTISLNSNGHIRL